MFEFKDNIETLEEFATYRSVITRDLKRANISPKTLTDVYQLLRNIDGLFADISRMHVELRQNPRQETVKKEIGLKRKEVSEALIVLNHNYLTELLMGDFNGNN